MCINDSTKIPDGSKCPAFALVTRCVPATVCGGSSKSDEKSGGYFLLVVVLCSFCSFYAYMSWYDHYLLDLYCVVVHIVSQHVF